MKLLGRFFYRVLFWTYDRGSWQWDVSCLFFLVVIFTTPQDFLMNYAENPLTPDQIRSLVVNCLKSFF
jgi:hypothetical protein